ncbi:MAG: hypothetical protein GX540_03585, partial [Clostridiales bacterium]|nr:hypothetical protein [Clostridiales bacterium]
GYIHRQPWPGYDENFLQADLVEIAVQINGKVRERLMVPSDLDRAAGEAELPRLPQVQALIGDRQLVKCVFVPGRLLNLVVK